MNWDSERKIVEDVRMNWRVQPRGCGGIWGISPRMNWKTYVRKILWKTHERIGGFSRGAVGASGVLGLKYTFDIIGLGFYGF